MKIGLVLVIFLMGFEDLHSQNDSCAKVLSVTYGIYSKLVSKYEKHLHDSDYNNLTVCDKITIIRLLNSMLVYKVLYTNKRYNDFNGDLLQSRWFIRIINDLGGERDEGFTPYNYSRYVFKRYNIFFGPPNFKNSIYKIYGLKMDSLFLENKKSEN